MLPSRRDDRIAERTPEDSKAMTAFTYPVTITVADFAPDLGIHGWR
jgi:hypothetical protein